MVATRHPPTPFLNSEAGGAVFLLGAALAALVWANIDLSSYTHVWGTELSVRFGHFVLSMDLRTWVNSGLMSFFFLVVGLEARREIDIGEFRERTRAVLPVLAGVGGMTAAIGLYLAIDAGRPSALGWGLAMSTDTAFALGLLALLGHRVPERLRAFVLTVTVVDDMVGVVVIATAYTRRVQVVPLLVAAGLFALVLVAVRLRVRYGLVYFALGIGAWVAMSKSGVDPIVVGLGAGLVAYAAPVARSDVERASSLFIEFREQPTPELARSARAGLRTVLPPNVRLEQLYLPWTSYLIVPLFGLANAGIPVDATTSLLFSLTSFFPLHSPPFSLRDAGWDRVHRPVVDRCACVQGHPARRGQDRRAHGRDLVCGRDLGRRPRNWPVPETPTGTGTSRQLRGDRRPRRPPRQ